MSSRDVLSCNDQLRPANKSYSSTCSVFCCLDTFHAIFNSARMGLADSDCCTANMFNGMPHTVVLRHDYAMRKIVRSAGEYKAISSRWYSSILKTLIVSFVYSLLQNYRQKKRGHLAPILTAIKDYRTDRSTAFSGSSAHLANLPRMRAAQAAVSSRLALDAM